MFEVAVRAKGKSKEGGGERKRGKVVCRERKGEREKARRTADAEPTAADMVVVEVSARGTRVEVVVRAREIKGD